MRTITFNDLPNFSFEYHATIPSAAKRKVNLAALKMYALYRNTVFDSYRKNLDVAEDIRTRPAQFPQEKHDSIYHYSVLASLGAMQEWKDPAEKMQCYIVYQQTSQGRSTAGFVHFNEKQVNGKLVVYIAQAGVTHRGQHLGRHLMQCVLAHYPADTEFCVLTRVFNTEAKTLYAARLGFTPLGLEEIQQLGYDQRYCGFRHTTTDKELAEIAALTESEQEHSLRTALAP